MPKPTQTQRVLQLITRRWLSPLEALQEIGCNRLAARIHDLKKLGFHVEHKDVRKKDTHWRCYRLKGEK